MSMKTMRKCEVPEYLKQGELYHTFVENDDDPNEEMAFPADVLKQDLSVNSMEDCDHLLNSLRYWGVMSFVPKALVKYVTSVPSFDESIGVLAKYASAFFYVRNVIEMVATDSEERIMEIAIRSGVIELVEAITEDGFPTNACDIAAEVGELEMLHYLLNHDCSFTKYTCRIAARHGHIHILRYMCPCSHKPTIKDLEAAAEGGHLDCIQYMTSFPRVVPLDCHREIAAKAVEHGHLHIMQYVGAHVQWRQMFTCETVAKNGHFDCLVFLHEKGCRWGNEACKMAAKNGHLDCLRFMHERECPWGAEVCEMAAAGGHLDCVVYAHDNGCRWGRMTCAHAALGGHLQCLQHLHEQGCAWDASTCSWAATGGHLNCLQYARDNGCPWDECACTNAAMKGHLECLKYLRENNCPNSDSVDIRVAISYGHLHIVKYTHEQGCDLGEDASTCAAEHGKLNCLEFLHALGIPYIKGDFPIRPPNPCYEFVMKHAP